MTGKMAWHFQAPALPFETPYTNGTGNLNGTYTHSLVAAHCQWRTLCTNLLEHSPTAPLYKRMEDYCAINATTGKEIWSTLGAMAAGVISDGYMTAFQTSMMDTYTFSAWVSAKPQFQRTNCNHSRDTNNHISGTVLDQSPAQPGTPCVFRRLQWATGWHIYTSKHIYKQML